MKTLKITVANAIQVLGSGSFQCQHSISEAAKMFKQVGSSIKSESASSCCLQMGRDELLFVADNLAKPMQWLSDVIHNNVDETFEVTLSTFAN